MEKVKHTCTPIYIGEIYHRGTRSYHSPFHEVRKTFVSQAAGLTWRDLYIYIYIHVYLIYVAGLYSDYLLVQLGTQWRFSCEKGFCQSSSGS